ncbi:MAG: ATP-dependent helicase, partial [Treponema sp.]|nr:ATP-dependent helicase [Treponema sp.]
MSDKFSISTLFSEYGFTPNKSQKEAIMTLEGPLFLTAGPGSGKTRVILWRTVNLIVFHNIKPEEIFLATFTEKAALQLKQGLQSLLSLASTHTGKPYDLGRMYIGTLHSLCQKLLVDRHLNYKKTRQRAPVLMDDLNQFLFVYNRANLNRILTAGQLRETGTDLYYRINEYFSSSSYGVTWSRSDCAANLIAFFGRLTEENFAAEELNSDDELEDAMFRMYLEYREMLSEKGSRVDFSTLQQAAYDYLCESTTIDQYIKYVIVDEYQDTNTIQELIYFKLAEKTHNICVVGDDDQALYRFRGATVENLVFFAEKTKKYLGVEPKRIDLNINYRSRKEIVDTYTHYIEGGDWTPGKKKTSYRLDKNIVANSKDKGTSVVHLSGNKKTLAEEVAQLVKEMKVKGKITDYNQCAILFPSLRSSGEANSNVREFGEALKALGIPHYAPRAYNFLYTEECLAMFGLMIKVFEPKIDEIDEDKRNKNRKEKFHVWLAKCENFANELLDDDPLLEKFIE